MPAAQSGSAIRFAAGILVSLSILSFPPNHTLAADSLLDWSTRPATNLTAATDNADVDGITVTTSGSVVGSRTSQTLAITPTTTTNGYSGIITSEVDATIDNESVYNQIVFGFSEPVYDLRFRVIDIDGFNSGGTRFSDLIIYNSSAGVPSSGTAGANVTYTTGTGRALENATSNCSGDQAACQVNIVYDGPITSATVQHVAADAAGGTNPTNQAIQIFDLTFNTPPNASNNSNTVNFTSTVGGNVISDNDGSGLDDDAQDGAAVLVNQISHGATTLAVGGGGTILNLANGAFLTIAQDGSYTFDTNGAYGALAPGASTSEVFTYRIEDQEGLFDAGSLATLTITITRPSNFDFTINKVADKSSVSTNGETITYTITVDNISTGELTGTSLTDTLSQNGSSLTLTSGPTLSGDTDGDSNLDAGETWIYTATYDVTTAVLNDGNDVLNVATFNTTEAGSKLASVPVSTPGPPIPCAGDTWPGNAISGVSGTTVCNNVGATSQGGEPTTYGGGAVNSIWYEWTAPADGTVTFDTCSVADTSFDTTLQAFTGTGVAALTTVATNDDFGTCTNFQSLISFAATLGTTYTIQVDGFGNATGNYRLSWNMIPLDADLSLAKTVDDASPISGTDVTYTLTLTNGGPGAAPAVQVIDLLPAGMTFVSASPSQGSFSQSGGTITWTVGDVLNGGTPTLDIVATSSGSTALTNTAQVTASGVTDPDSTPGDGTGDDFASVDVTPVENADLSVVKTVDDPAPTTGTDVTFTITLTNDGPHDAASVEVTDVLPVGLTFVSANPSQGSFTETTGTVVWNAGTVSNGTAPTLEIVATTSGTSLITNAAEVTASGTADPDSTPNDGAGDDYGTVGLTPTAPTGPVGFARCVGTDLVTNGGFETPVFVAPPGSNMASPGSVPGWSTTDTAIEIWENGFLGVPSHTGNQFAELNANVAGTLTNASATVQPRAELQIYWAHRARSGTDTANLAISDNGGGSTSAGNFSSTTANWSEFSATHLVTDTGSSATLNFTAVSTGSGSISVGNFLDTVEICQTYVTLGKTATGSVDVDTSGSVTPGDTITYQFSVSNPAGNEKSVSGVQIVDDKIGTFVATPTSGDDGNGVLDPGETWIVNANYTITQTDVDAESVTNIAYVEGTTGTNTIRSDDETENFVLTAAPSLLVTKLADDDTEVIVGQVLTYTYTITNNGNQTLTNVSMSDVHGGSGTAPVPDPDTATLTDNGPVGDSVNPTTGDSVWDTLAPGDVLTTTATYTVTQSDVDTLQ